MAMKEIAVQGTDTVEWESWVEVDVPDSILADDDPDALSAWAETNITYDMLSDNRTDLSVSTNRTGADVQPR